MNISIDLPLLVANLAIDMGICDFDRTYILKRLNSEGHKFLTISLPKFAKHVLLSLERGFFRDEKDDILCNFSKKGPLTRFLWDELTEIFDHKSKNGVLVADPSAIALCQVRQVCEYFYKLALPYTSETVEKAIDSFVKNEGELEDFAKQGGFNTRFVSQMRKDFFTQYDFSGHSIDEVFQKDLPRVTSGTYVGAEPDFFLVKETVRFRSTLPTSSKPHMGAYRIPRSLFYGRRVEFISEPPFSELLLVQKDSRGPRTICREHPHRVRTQMAFFSYMTRNLNRASAGAINFLNQDTNRRIAETSSIDAKFATLDLKDASDMVSFELVKKLFWDSPWMRYFFVHHRANQVVMPHQSGRRALYKLAGMGSGLTFPTMALIISLAICRSVVNRFGLSYDFVRRNVFIYGDDICLPTEWVPFAIEALEVVKLKVNKSKSYYRGSFRESCGGDYFRGNDVGPVRIKLANSQAMVLGNNIILKKSDVSINQLYKHAIECCKAQMKNTAKYLLSIVSKCVKLEAGVLGDHSYMVNPFKGTGHFKPDQQVVVTQPVSVKSRLPGDFDMLRSLAINTKALQPRCSNSLHNRKTVMETELNNECEGKRTFIVDPHGLTTVEAWDIIIPRLGHMYPRSEQTQQALLAVALTDLPPSRSEGIGTPRNVRLKSCIVPSWLFT